MQVWERNGEPTKSRRQHGGDWLTFTEIAFELRDAHPVTAATERQPLHAILRVIDTGLTSARFRAHISVHASAADTTAYAAALRERGDADVDVVHAGESGGEILWERDLEAAGPLPPLVAAFAVLRRFGVDTIFEPILMVDGMMRVRLVVPQALNTDEALAALQEIHMLGLFASFRVLRVGNLEAAQQLALQRRGIPPDHEDLLEMATAMGYYELPKRSTLQDIANKVGLSISPIHKRLKAAEEAVVRLHVARDEEPPRRRRSRRDTSALDGDRPLDLGFRIRGPDIGPARFLADHPEARALVQPISCDRERDRATWLVVLLAEPMVQSAYLNHLESEAQSVDHAILARDGEHLSLRVTGSGVTGYGGGWFQASWSDSVYLRNIFVEGSEAIVRLTTTRPIRSLDVNESSTAMTKLARGRSHEVVCARAIRMFAHPTRLPSPLTPRQAEVLRIAHALGYYRTPRNCTLDTVASTLGVSPNAIHKNLVGAESKLVTNYLAATR